jgi:hypothetical protein
MTKHFLTVFLVMVVPSYGQSNTGNTGIQAAISTQSSDGVKQEAMNNDFLKALEEHTKKRVKFHAEAYLKSIGSKITSVDIQASSVYIHAGNFKLAVTRLNASNTAQVHILGIRGDEAIRVTCASQSPNPIPLSYGKCADKIYEAYGVKIGR